MFGRKRVEEISGEKVYLSSGIESLKVSMRSGDLHTEFVIPSEKEEEHFIDPERAVKIIRRLSVNILGKDPRNPKEIDNLLFLSDGTREFLRIGKNTALGISAVSYKISSFLLKRPLYQKISEEFSRKPKIPKIFFTLIEGQNLGHFPFKELYLITEIEKIRDIIEIFEYFRREIKKRFGKSYIFPGFRGGFSVNIIDPVDVMLTLSRIIEEVNPEIKIGVDFNASNYYFEEKYEIVNKMGREEYIEYIRDFLKTFKNISWISSPLSKEDEMYTIELRKIGREIEIFGERPSERFDGTSMFLSKIGTVSSLANKKEKILLKDNTFTTCDTFIVELSVGLGIEYLNIGGINTFERIIKYNRLLEISSEI